MDYTCDSIGYHESLRGQYEVFLVLSDEYQYASYSSINGARALFIAVKDAKYPVLQRSQLHLTAANAAGVVDSNKVSTALAFWPVGPETYQVRVSPTWWEDTAQSRAVIRAYKQSRLFVPYEDDLAIIQRLVAAGHEEVPHNWEPSKLVRFRAWIDSI